MLYHLTNLWAIELNKMQLNRAISNRQGKRKIHVANAIHCCITGPNHVETKHRNLNFTCVVFSLLAFGLNGASVSRTGCSLGFTANLPKVKCQIYDKNIFTAVVSVVCKPPTTLIKFELDLPSPYHPSWL